MITTTEHHPILEEEATLPCGADPAEAAEPLLRGTGITVRFGGLTAVDHVDFCIAPGSIMGLIGPNGAGKTTLFNAISAQVKLSEGKVLLHGKHGPVDCTHLHTHQITAAGIGRTFQNTRIFKRMTVLENVLVGAHWRFDRSIFAVMFGTLGYRREERQRIAEGHELLGMVGLDRHANDQASSLPYRRAGGFPAPCARTLQPRHLPDRARHEIRHVLVATDHGAQRRAQDCRGHPRRDPEQP